MIPNKELSKGGAHTALVLNAMASAPVITSRRAEVCLRCGMKRVPHSSIVVVRAEGRIEEAPLCGACTRRMSR